MRIELTTGFTTLSVTEGTFQNVSRIVPIEIATSATEGTGIVLNPGEIVPVKSEATIYARSAWENPNPTEKVWLAHEPFKRIGGGGDYTLPTMTETKKGGAKLGNGLYTQNDHLNLNYMGTRTLGGAMVGAGLHTDSGTLDLNMMGASVFGGAMVGAGLHTEGWSIVLNTMGASVKGGAMLGAGLHTDAGAVHLNEMGASVFGGAKLGTGLYTQDGALNLRQMNESVIGGAKLGKSMSIVTDRIEAIQHRKPSQAYALGDIAFVTVSGVKTQQLVCVKAGTTGNGDFALPSGYGEGSIHNDGTVVWAVDSFADGNYSAGHHNGIYREADLTAYFDSGLMSANIQTRTYLNIYVGDYITKKVTIDDVEYDRKWMVAHIEYYNLGNGHIIFIAHDGLSSAVMNDTNSTVGGYVASKMWTVEIPKYVTAIKGVFGSSHVLTHNEWLSDAIVEDAPSMIGGNQYGSASHWIGVNVDVNIPSSLQITGNGLACSSTWTASEVRFALFEKAAYKAPFGGTMWLRDVAWKFGYGIIFTNGMYNAIMQANGSGNSFPIRPYFAYR